MPAALDFRNYKFFHKFFQFQMKKIHLFIFSVYAILFIENFANFRSISSILLSKYRYSPKIKTTVRIRINGENNHIFS